MCLFYYSQSKWNHTANMFFKSFYLIYYTSFLFGTLPFVFKNGFHPSKILLTHTFINILLCFIHGIITPYMMLEHDYSYVKPTSKPETTTNVSDLITLIRNQTSAQISTMRIINPLILNFMSLGCSSGVVLFLKPKFVDFISNIDIVDKTLQPICKINFKQDSIASFLLFFYFTCIVTPVCGLYLITSYDDTLEFIWSVFVVHNNLATFTSELQFLFLALVLKFRFKGINKYLKDLEGQNMFKMYKTRIFMSNNGTLQNIELIRYCSRKLSDMLEDLNSMYKLHLLTSIAGCFLKILFNIYLVIFSWFFSNQGTLYLVKTVMWSWFYFFRFIVTTIISSMTTSEASKTKIILSSMSNRNFAPEIKEELDIFLLNTSNRNFKFTACGLLTINTRLITSAIAACATYLVILVQFRPVA